MGLIATINFGSAASHRDHDPLAHAPARMGAELIEALLGR